MNGVILLRSSSQDPRERLSKVLEASKIDDIQGSFVIIGDHGMKVRRPKRR